uniref:Enoyl-CoA hydratase 1 n=1 Tax=Anolis carolinensis TaxID=28377 RepID=A0A803TTL7_ANOCA
MAGAGVALKGLLLRKSLLVCAVPCRGLRMTPIQQQQQEKSSAVDTYETLKLERVRDKVLHVELNRPEKRNAMNVAFWREMVECFNKISQDSECHAVVISGAGKLFTSGIDLMEMGSIFVMVGGDDTARKAWNIRRKIREYQETFTVLEKCPKPVIAAIHGGCIGGGMNLISACDIRYCTQDAWFQVKEVDIGIAADVGVLQRLPRIIGNHRSVRISLFVTPKVIQSNPLHKYCIPEGNSSNLCLKISKTWRAHRTQNSYCSKNDLSEVKLSFPCCLNPLVHILASGATESNGLISPLSFPFSIPSSPMAWFPEFLMEIFIYLLFYFILSLNGTVWLFFVRMVA